eukprot:TRINITY_DN77182_c0_g1_i1.p1 TRINITY_DN77182_c0_g1~~TRINITY_DN77182_c0_g1_i1.p1  ORF type:complete len:104 (+),score=20.99 TRINITY_DN77182_c0_g1_i1:22-312(+)
MVKFVAAPVLANLLSVREKQLFIDVLECLTNLGESPEGRNMIKETESNIVAQVQGLAEQYNSALAKKKSDEFVRQFKFSTRPFQSLPGAKLKEVDE